MQFSATDRVIHEEGLHVYSIHIIVKKSQLVTNKICNNFCLDNRRYLVINKNDGNNFVGIKNM